MENAQILPANLPQIDDEFTALGVKVDRLLTDEEVRLVSGCVGYGLRPNMQGCELSDPVHIMRDGKNTVLTFYCDSEDCTRTNPDPHGALTDGALYVQQGTPQRKTTRTGPVGSRLVEGIGPCHLTFAVGNSPEEVLRALNPQATPVFDFEFPPATPRHVTSTPVFSVSVIR